MSLDEDEIDAIAQAGAVVLRWAVVLLGVGFLARVACGCGGAEFEVGIFPDAGATVAQDSGLVDASTARTLTDAPASTGSQSPEDGSRGSARKPSGDAGAPLQDAGAIDPPPTVDADRPPVDAGEPPPPPALCCLTPCSGSSPAAITCGNGPEWTCAAGSCSDRACAVGAACAWMGGSCVGRVEVCP
jgi:hypothetical protein